MALSIQFLGTGTSVGVPQIGCSCPTCVSDDPRDRRHRTGVYVCSDRVAFVIDTPPEFRIACLELKIRRVDAVVLTHAHMDHLAGFDDVRRFNTLNGGVPMRCFGAPETIEAVRHIFPYITDKANAQGLFRPMIHFSPVEGPFKIGDVAVTPLTVVHGPRTNGYLMTCGKSRIGYISDAHTIPDDVIEKLHGVDIMILNCLRERPHPTHLSRAEALAYMKRIAPVRGFLIHMCHDVKHAEFEAELPPPIKLAYDGLKLEC